MFFAKDHLWSERDSWGSELVLPDDGDWLQGLQELAHSKKPGCKLRLAKALLECKERCRMVRVMLSYSADEPQQLWEQAYAADSINTANNHTDRQIGRHGDHGLRPDIKVQPRRRRNIMALALEPRLRLPKGAARH